MKRSLSLFLSLVIALCVCLSAPFAIKSKAATVDDLTFELNYNGESYSIVDCDESASGELVINETYNGLPVTSIDVEAFRNCNLITSVTIPKTIGNLAEFLVTEDEGWWDYYPQDCFSGCLSLQEIVVDDDNLVYSSENGVLFNKEKTKLIYYPEGKKDGSYVIPESVSVIVYAAFANCDNLVNLIIGDGDIDIGAYSFSGCDALKTVEIGIGKTGISERAFSDCTSLSSVFIDDGDVSIDENAFEDCLSLETLEIGKGKTKMDWFAFENCTSLFSVSIDDGELYLGEYIFSGSSNLTYITLGVGVVNIDESAFGYKKDLIFTVVYDSHAYQYVKDNGFKYTDKSSTYPVSDLGFELNDDGISYSVYIESYYFDNNISTKLIVPSEYNGLPVTSILGYAFYNENIISITIPNSINNISEDVFNGFTSLKETNVDESNPNYLSVDGVLFNKDKTALLCYPRGKTDTDYVIPDSVTSLDEGVFRGCDYLKNITISNSVTSIGAETFVGCSSLETVNIPESVTYINIGEGFQTSPFSNCTSLKEINVDESNPNYSSIDGVLFNKDRTALISYPIGKKADSYVVPDTVIYISRYAFNGCLYLINITISKSVRSIGMEAFDCHSLENVYITDIKNWCLIDFEPECRWGSGGHTTGNCMANPMYCATNLFLNNELVTEIVIPEGITEIKDYSFFGFDLLKSVTIPNGVTEIGTGAFEGCSSLEKIIIPEGITYIGSWSFDGCKSLTSISIPKTVTGIGTNAFGDCISLEAVYITDISNWCKIDFLVDEFISNPLYYANNLYLNGELVTELLIPDDVTNIMPSAFCNCTSLKKITIPNSVISIGESEHYADTQFASVFSGCHNVQEINVSEENLNYSSVDGVLYNKDKTVLMLYPTGKTVESFAIIDTVTRIEDFAFDCCKSLENLIIPDSVTSIGNYPFKGCTSLTSVTIGSGVTSIYNSVFKGCSSLTSITLPDSVMNIGDSAFSDTAYYNNTSNWENDVLYIGNHLIKANESLSGDYVIKVGTKCIADDAFEGCTELTSVTIPDSVTSIGNYAFAGCTELTSVTIGDSVTSIGDYAFAGCTELTSVTIGDSVMSIDGSAFKGCSSLTSITIPGSVMNIGGSAFKGCSSLTSITIPDSVIYIGNLAFSDTAYYNNSSNWENDVLYIGNHLIKAKESLSGDYVIKVGTKCIADDAFSCCESITSVTIPDSVTTIDDFSFYFCTSLSSVTIGSGVTSIGWSAFGGCYSLTSVTIPANVKTIDYHAFEYCTSLTSITILGSVTSIGRGVFTNCSSLTSITIPDTVTNIGDDAFRGCLSLTSITIPDSVTNIGWSAFENCDSLKYVFYTGSLIDWSNMSIEKYNSPLTSAKIHYNATGHSHSCSIKNAPTEQENGKAIDTCPVCGFINSEEGIVYINKYITAVDTKNAVVDATTNTLLLDMSACKDINEAIVEMDGYTLTTTPTSDYGFIGTGSKVQVTDTTGTQVAEYTLVVRGDVNGDSVCDALDLMLIELARQTNNNVTLEGAYFAAANLAEDSEINIDDFNAVVNKAVV